MITKGRQTQIVVIIKIGIYPLILVLKRNLPSCLFKKDSFFIPVAVEEKEFNLYFDFLPTLCHSKV